MADDKQAQMAALDAMLAEGAAPAPEEALPGTVTCGACGATIDSATGAPLPTDAGPAPLPVPGQGGLPF